MTAHRSGGSAVLDPFATRRRWLLAFLAVTIAAAGALSLGMGAVTIGPGEVVEVLSRRLGVAIGDEPSQQADAVLWAIRLPRILTAIVVGVALGLAGAALQGVFRNALADPQLLAIAPGASLGAVIGVALLTGAGRAAAAGGAVGGVLTALLLRRLGETGSPEPSRFVLAGVALGAVLSAWVGFVVFAADSTTIPPVEFWLLGSLTGATWRVLGSTVVLVAIGAVVLFASSRSLDLMALGEAEARHLGVEVDLVTSSVLLAVGVTTGAAVGAVGIVGFVGLLVPHLVRRFTGPAHRGVLGASALAGAILMLVSDLFARTIASPQEIPVGLVTAVIGGPFFLWLLRRLNKQAAA